MAEDSDPFGPERPSIHDQLERALSHNQRMQDRYQQRMEYQQGIGGMMMSAARNRLMGAMHTPGGLGTPFTGGMAASQDVMGLAYHGGFGQFLRAGTGGLLGRSAGFSQGMPFGAMHEMATDELNLRAGEFFSSASSSLTLGMSDMLGSYAPGLSASRRRSMASMLSGQAFTRGEGGTMYGFGLRTSSGALGRMDAAMGATMDRLQRGSGYAMSYEDMESLQNAALGVLGSSRLGNLVGKDSGAQKAALGETVRQVKAMSENLQVSYEAAGQIIESLSFAIDPQKNAGMMRMMINGRVSGMSGMQYGALMRQQLSAARAMGAYDPGQATSIALAGASQMQGLFQAGQSGAIPLTLMSAWGGATEVDQRANAMQAMHRYGLQFGLGSPGMASLYQVNPGSINAITSGAGYMSVLGMGAQASMSNPLAAMTARYNPRTLHRMRQTGMAAAYSMSGRQMELMQSGFGGLMPEGSEEAQAFRIRRFQQLAGIEDESRAIASFQMMQYMQGAVGGEQYIGVANRAINAGIGNLGGLRPVIKNFEAANVNMNDVSSEGLMSAMGVGLPPAVQAALADLESIKGYRLENMEEARQTFANAKRALGKYISDPKARARMNALLSHPPGKASAKLRLGGGMFGAIGGGWYIDDPRAQEMMDIAKKHLGPETGTAIREYMMSNATAGVSVLLGGTQGPNNGVRLSALSGMKNLSAEQMAFLSGYSETGVNLDAVWAMGPEAAQSFLHQMSAGGMEMASKIERVQSKADFQSVASSLDVASKGTQARQSYLAVYANHHLSALTAVHKDRLGTPGYPMHVRDVDRQ